MLEQGFHLLSQPRLDSFGASNNERTRPMGELRIEQQKRQACEMIAVEMRDQDEVDRIARDGEPLQRRQRGCAAIDQEIDVLAGDMEAGVEPATGTERIAAADKLQLHRTILPIQPEHGLRGNEARSSAG